MNDRERKDNDLGIDLDMKGLTLDSDEAAKPQAQNRPMSHEDMARMIAKNMAMQDGGFDEPITPVRGVSDFGEETVKPKKPKTTETRSKNAKPASKQTSKSGSKNGKKKKKKSSSGKTAAIAICSVVGVMIVAAGGFYLWGMNSYKDRFLGNTYINGIEVSGKTKAEAYKLVSEQAVIPKAITVTKKDGTTFSIKLSEIGYNDNTQNLITQYYTQQNHYSWFSSAMKRTDFTFESKFKYDKAKLEKVLKRKVLDSQSTKDPEDAYIKKGDDNSYVVVKETTGDAVEEGKIDELYSYVENQIDDGSFDVDISKADCYKKPAITADMLEETCKKLNNLNDIEITFDFIYTTETLTGDTIMDWITFDEDNAEAGYTVDEDKAMAYVEDLADKYDTFGKDREFKTTKRGTITISEGQGCYGWWIDQQKTCDLIVDLVEKGESAETEPVYYVNPDSAYEYTCNKDWRTADKDYGNTYIEVDLTAQHLWYYKDGKLTMESDIVSGYPSKSRNTPGGVYKLWYKEKGKTLRGSADGQSYASYVDYWNNVSTIGIGLHDASWQNGNFGGERYKSSTWGSHGCINMPLDKAKYVYEKIDMGTPVFMYW